ncbi:thermonuclease family protein [Mesorhizobium sp. A623]
MSKGILTIIAAMTCAAAAGYFGPDALAKLPMSASVSPAAMKFTQTLVGRASVIDGDTIEIHGERVRFNGIDAPESAQQCTDGGHNQYRCGAKAAHALAIWLAASSPTTCEFVSRDQYDRFVGNCTRANGDSVQRWLVRNGHAMDWPRYSKGVFASEQSAAKSAKLGIWRGEVQPPWEWRAAKRDAVVAPTLTTIAGQGGNCEIKGNISKKGERIYHVPGQKYYGKTRITPSKGEQWFCSEGDARAAGWRRSRR